MKNSLNWKLSMFFGNIANFFNRIGMYFFDKVMDKHSTYTNEDVDRFMEVNKELMDRIAEND